MPAAPAALRNERRDSSGVAGHPHGCGRGLDVDRVVSVCGHVRHLIPWLGVSRISATR